MNNHPVETLCKTHYADILPLVEYLKVDKDLQRSIGIAAREAQQQTGNTANYFVKEQHAEQLINDLRDAGSNSLKSVFTEPSYYSEIVYDVGLKLKADVSKTNLAKENEDLIIGKLFADAVAEMSEEEKSELLLEFGYETTKIPAALSVMGTQLGLRSLGFSTYRMAVIIANYIARALLNRGLTFGGNILVTRTIGVALGPVGWFASGLWLAFDLAGPAYRKTIPAVVQIAMLRQLAEKRVNIGIVGEGSCGKDSLIRETFGVDTNNVSAVPGSTSKAEAYALNEAATVMNYAGFHDSEHEVNENTADYLIHTDVFVWVVDIQRGITGTELETFEKLKRYNRPVVLCINKVDTPKNDADKEALINSINERLELNSGKSSLIKAVFETAFDPDPRLMEKAIGGDEVLGFLRNFLSEKLGKDSDCLDLA
ncbi:GTPase [Idiomarina loihiensis]|uniref:Predicted C-terminal GTPase domain fused to uncharaterized conserved domain n=1 Tax=Idiomarina loihiensis (strain ATCC BAA-735 / DSM 15497 / L2-TR) TaxID=283942 RepID=Q5R096_IDILO|nr:GTPase [Idiomarina loihiensis]AAV81377.1 Predicted C-terminal GTPase domain fused to uncharaterized conserved domain [Idiomarina loihiensis L2TR]AGM35404.1 GTPase domain/uncharacterized domain-containing protein [Idiomarina loihiensis GSL 199]